MPSEPVDLFADGFQIFVGGFGSAIHFQLSEADHHVGATPPGQLLPSRRVATVRMTPEMLKGLAFLIHQQVNVYERTNPRIELPADSMQRMAAAGITAEQWHHFWGYT